MMKVRLLTGLTIISLSAALGGCVSYGTTHALVTPVGVVGYHSFKPDNQSMPREITLPEQSTPDRIAAANDSNQ
ncbi:MAG: hypothetical protein SXG53_08750 [Pseudomonadota bacterium]|nr:hypothetical protein [Pseudomonadota bacterium]